MPRKSTTKRKSIRPRIKALLESKTREQLYDMAATIAERKKLTGYSNLDKRGLAKFIAQAEAGKLKPKSRVTKTSVRQADLAKRKARSKRHGSKQFYGVYLVQGKPKEGQKVGYFGPFASARAAKIEAKGLLYKMESRESGVSESGGDAWAARREAIQGNPLMGGYSTTRKNKPLVAVVARLLGDVFVEKLDKNEQPTGLWQADMTDFIPPELLRTTKVKKNGSRRRRNTSAKPTIKSDYRSTYHRDGTVSFWNVNRQQWQRRDADAIPSSVLSTMNNTERTRIARMAARRNPPIPGAGSAETDRAIPSVMKDPARGTYTYVYRYARGGPRASAKAHAYFGMPRLGMTLDEVKSETRRQRAKRYTYSLDRLEDDNLGRRIQKSHSSSPRSRSRRRRLNPRVSFQTKDGPVSFQTRSVGGKKAKSRRNPSKAEAGLKRRLATFGRKVAAIETSEDLHKTLNYLNTVYSWALNEGVQHLIPDGLGKQAQEALDDVVRQRQSARRREMRRLRQQVADEANRRDWRRL